jgi:hypothetical protein
MEATEWASRFESMLNDQKRDPLDFDGHIKRLATESSTCRTWNEFQKWIAPFGDQWCFRGEKDAKWTLISSFDRNSIATFTVQHGDIQITSNEKLNEEDDERRLLLDFQRGAGHFHSSLPTLDETVDWLALMQHFGAPTRLVDWSRSPYVALYFALEESFDDDSVLWAIDMTWLKRRSLEILRSADPHCPDSSDFVAFVQYVNQIILGGEKAFAIVPADPMQLNERMIAQQGQLLCNVGKSTGFTNVLLGMLINTTPTKDQVISRSILKREHRIGLLEELQRMNIHRASLFPGIDGFARSLAVTLQMRIANASARRKARMLEEMKAHGKRHPRGSSK